MMLVFRKLKYEMLGGTLPINPDKVISVSMIMTGAGSMQGRGRSLRLWGCSHQVAGEPGPGVSASPGGQSWLLEPGWRVQGIPELISDHWLGGTGVGFWHSWGWDPRGPRVSVDLLVGKARAQLVPGQGLACHGWAVSTSCGIVGFCVWCQPTGGWSWVLVLWWAEHV